MESRKNVDKTLICIQNLLLLLRSTINLDIYYRLLSLPLYQTNMSDVPQSMLLYKRQELNWTQCRQGQNSLAIFVLSLFLLTPTWRGYNRSKLYIASHLALMLVISGTPVDGGVRRFGGIPPGDGHSGDLTSSALLHGGNILSSPGPCNGRQADNGGEDHT